ncbi:hypothetical protein [Anaeromyxobacter sp. SG66]|uniref:hypothetical protein n=1 Tax=Anaeromyxobacter sp. SG66 TaxID=2925410 RepID=UPI001F59FB87|nr:hypothetical protein [Anaeromyxobacter sp. SG66]
MARKTCTFIRKNGKRCKNEPSRVGLGRYCRLHASALARDAAFGAVKFGATTVAGGLLWEVAKKGIEATTGVKMRKACGAAGGRKPPPPQKLRRTAGVRNAPPATMKKRGGR